MSHEPTTKHYTTIIFDFYGVVCNPISSVWAKGQGVPMSDVEQLHEDAIHRADRGEVSADDVYDAFGAKVHESKDEVHQEWLNLACIDPDTLDVMKALKKHYKIALCSNAFSFIREIFTKTGVDTLFDHIIISSEVGLAKPDPRIFEYTLKHVGATASEAIFIDDTLANVESARSVGITGIHFTSAQQLKNDLQSAGVIVEL